VAELRRRRSFTRGRRRSCSTGQARPCGVPVAIIRALLSRERIQQCAGTNPSSYNTPRGADLRQRGSGEDSQRADAALSTTVRQSRVVIDSVTRLGGDSRPASPVIAGCPKPLTAVVSRVGSSACRWCLTARRLSAG